MKKADPLSLFLPPVQRWFRSELGEPTPVQRQGWPVIASGKSALLLAPTGSGKTLAAFLACLDGLWRQRPLPRATQILYISPLKALNNDIARNLQVPLEGVARVATEMNGGLPEIDVAVRTGDTPPRERQRLLRHPPHVLITTPESLHLLLTSRARDTLRGITHCIVDEIHALCPNKRGVFLALLLERLQALNAKPFARIGLSATQRPLDEVARYLGGFNTDADGAWHQRPVTIVDVGLRKHLDLRVISPVEHFGPLPEKTIWPSIYRLLAEEVSRHRSTIIFVNNRRSVERLTAQLNEQLAEMQALASSASAEEEGSPANAAKALSSNPPRPSGVTNIKTGAIDWVRAHHGSVALEVRQRTEQALKEGRLRAVVATASLELGIDMGAVDLVCQLESPGNVARALQRVGRAGHLVGQSSKGRLIPKTIADLLNLAVLTGEMVAGRVEALRVPMNPLDVLAQQIIAMTAMDDWPVDAIYNLVRKAYSYHDLTPAALDAVLEMVTGRYRFRPLEAVDNQTTPGLSPGQQLSALQPRISWDRIHQRLQALPGSQRLALVHGGTIPDTGQYGVYTTRGLRVGEIDEEFVYERRVGDAFLLGTSAWRIDSIGTDRVLVVPAEGAPAMAPFWRGEMAGRTYDLGLAQGKFLRELSQRLDQPDCLNWLQEKFLLDRPSSESVRDYAKRQRLRTGCIPNDQLLVIEASRDPLGDWQVILLSPFGRALHFGLRLAIEKRLKERLGYSPQCVHHDDGVLVRLTESAEPVLDLLEGITVENVREMILEELGESALFALRFRQNAARALMMPRGAAGKRAPLWLQRLRGRDLLQVARRHPDFPVVAETFRECLHDHLDLPHLQQLLEDIASGVVQVKPMRLEMPSPFAATLLFSFNAAYMYVFDGVESASDQGSVKLDQEFLDQLIGHHGRPLPLDPRAVRQVDRRLRGVGLPPRTKPEMAEWLRKLGDASPDELEGPMLGFLRELEAEGVASKISLQGCPEPQRWILAEEAHLYESAFAADRAAAEETQAAATIILHRFLETHALIGLDDVLARYPLDRNWAERQLEEWTRIGRLVRVVTTEAEPLQWSAAENFEQMQRGTLSIMRREVVTCPKEQFADFLAHWHKVHPADQASRPEALSDVLERLQGCFLATELWEQAILPLRCTDYQPRQLDDLVAQGDWTWITQPDPTAGTELLGFLKREAFPLLTPPAMEGINLEDPQSSVMDLLRTRGALFLSEIAEHAGLTQGVTRSILWSLLRVGLVTNDKFDLLRRGEPPRENEAPVMRSRGELRAFLRDTRRRLDTAWPEGRWSLAGWGAPDPEEAAFFQARLLLQRYGIVARELALMSGTSLSWRILYEVLSRMELAGEVRRGYFAEGLSGAQFALPEASRLLQECALPSSTAAPVLLIHSLDPANLYGSGAPFELPIAQHERTFSRRPGNWLVWKAGRPLLIIEQQGKRLTPLPAANAEELKQAVARLPELLKHTPRADIRHKLTVETWNEEPVTSTVGKDMLEQAGFVRDYQAMTLYAVWQ